MASLQRLWTAVLLLVATTAALTPAQWRSQSIYQVITDRFALTSGSTTAACSLGDYCGGTWQGLINNLDYIQGMGFTAVWISPVVKNLDTETAYGRPYHGYWAQDIYSLNSHFGTASDLKQLSAALHARGMYLMVDVVTNHMGYNGAPSSVQYSTFNPFNSQSYYHPYCAIDFNNITSVQDCWTGDAVVSLPDLRTENSNVQAMWNTWIAQLVKNYTIDGLRIDSAMEVNQGFFPSFVSAAGVYAVGEVFNGDPDVLCPYQNYMPGVLNYGSYFWVIDAFSSTDGEMTDLVNGISWLKSSCKDTTLMGNFLENQDNTRFAALTNDTSLTENAIAYTMLSDGIPIIYYGQEQGFAGAADPYNREALWTSGYDETAPMYSFISQLNTIRQAVMANDGTYVTSQANIMYSDGATIATRKGASGRRLTTVFTNRGSSGTGSVTLPSSATGWGANNKFTDLLTCTVYTTDSSGNLAVDLTDGVPRILYPNTALSGLGLCPSCSVTFYEDVSTTWGESIMLTGSISQLGTWDTTAALSMSATKYTSASPVWNLTVSLPEGTSFEYKFLNVDSSGDVTWEDGSNRAYTVPTSCSSSGVTISDSWQ